MKAVYTKKEKAIRIACIALSELFTVITFIYLMYHREYSHISTCAITAILIWLPVMGEYILQFRMGKAFHLLTQLYVLLPMIGEAYKLYYTTQWWDKLLHMWGGFTFAAFGFYLFAVMTDLQDSRKLAGILFAFCFSMTVSVLWEFFEFAVDTFLYMDMQSDTVVHRITSYHLDAIPGVRGTVDNILQVTANGKILPVDGYLDIGLIDTMHDLIADAAGALAFAVCHAVTGSGFHLMVNTGHIPPEVPRKNPHKDDKKH